MDASRRTVRPRLDLFDCGRCPERTWYQRAQPDGYANRLSPAIAFARRHSLLAKQDQRINDRAPRVEVSTLGDEILDFYQPDEDLRVEDIVPDIEVPTPEQIAETRELQRLLRTLLGQMPEEWRRALVLHDILGRSETDVAKIIGKQQSDVGRILERARESLRQNLTEYGYGVKRAA